MVTQRQKGTHRVVSGQQTPVFTSKGGSRRLLFGSLGMLRVLEVALL